MFMMQLIYEDSNQKTYLCDILGSNSRVFDCCNRNNHAYKNLYEFTYA